MNREIESTYEWFIQQLWTHWVIWNVTRDAKWFISSHIYTTPILKYFYWLKINERIKYQFLSRTCKKLNSSHPAYILSLLGVNRLIFSCPSKPSFSSFSSSNQRTPALQSSFWISSVSTCSFYVASCHSPFSLVKKLEGSSGRFAECRQISLPVVRCLVRRPTVWTWWWWFGRVCVVAQNNAVEA